MIKKYFFFLILILGLLLISVISCDNRTEVEEIPTCNYIFTATALEDATINVAHDINIFIAKANNYTCNTAYTMTYTVVYDGINSNNGLFVYNGENIAHDTPFTVTPNNFIAKFNALQVGTYDITFTVKNTEAEDPIQSKTLKIIFSN